MGYIKRIFGWVELTSGFQASKAGEKKFDVVEIDLNRGGNRRAFVIRFLIEIIFDLDLVLNVKLPSHSGIRKHLRRCTNQHKAEVDAQSSEDEDRVLGFTVVQTLMCARVIDSFRDDIAVRLLLKGLFRLSFFEFTVDHVLCDRFWKNKVENKVLAICRHLGTIK